MYYSNFRTFKIYNICFFHSYKNLEHLYGRKVTNIYISKLIFFLFYVGYKPVYMDYGLCELSLCESAELM